MEIGNAVCCSVKPQQAVLHVVEQRFVSLLLTTHGSIQEFSQEQRDGNLRRVGRQRSIGKQQSCITHLLQLNAVTHVALHIQQAQRLEKLLLQTSLAGLRYADDT